MDLAVVLTANDRPQYLREVLASWDKVEGIDDVPVLLSVEPGCDEVDEIRLDWTNNTDHPRGSWVNDEKLGPHGNPFRALAVTFSLLDPAFVILGEDDSVVSSDVLAYFRAMALNFAGNPDIFTVNACNLRCGQCCDRNNHVRRGGFCSTVWGLWDYRWEEVRKTWGMSYDDEGGWDMKFTRSVKGPRDCLIPCVSRAQHIGQYGGAHMDPSEFEEKRSHCFDPEPNRTEAWSVVRSYQ